MQIILLDKVVNLGNLGEIVRVKDGYARNFLIPSGRACQLFTHRLRFSQFGGGSFFKFSALDFKLLLR